MQDYSCEANDYSDIKIQPTRIPEHLTPINASDAHKLQEGQISSRYNSLRLLTLNDEEALV